jgi:hypothetical protein
MRTNKPDSAATDAARRPQGDFDREARIRACLPRLQECIWKPLSARHNPRFAGPQAADGPKHGRKYEHRKARCPIDVP